MCRCREPVPQLRRWEDCLLHYRPPVVVVVGRERGEGLGELVHCPLPVLLLCEHALLPVALVHRSGGGCPVILALQGEEKCC